MARRCHRATSSLAVLMDREIARAYRAVGLTPPARLRPPRPPPRTPRHLHIVPAPTPAAPPPRAPRLSPELEAYCRQFPTVPAWFAELDPEDLVTNLDVSRLPCMADAEDGEQPWNDTRLDEHGNVIAGSLAFPFVGPPDDALVD